MQTSNFGDSPVNVSNKAIPTGFLEEVGALS